MAVHVLVVGSANADLVVPARRRPGGGETVLGGDTEILPGGKGANTAVAAARLGAGAALLGAVGHDGHGRILRDSLVEAGVRTELVRTVDRPTGIAYITVTPDGENSILVSPGANQALRPEDVDDVAVATAEVLVSSLEIPRETVEHALRTASAAGTTTVLNLSPAAELDSSALAAVDVLLVNEHEAAWLLGSGSADPAALLELGPRTAVVTAGSRGAAVLTRRGRAEVPAEVVTAVDTTGAGDAFAGALATALAGVDAATRLDPACLTDAVATAVRVAAVSVTRRGAQPSYPTSGEISSAN